AKARRAAEGPDQKAVLLLGKEAKKAKGAKGTKEKKPSAGAAEAAADGSAGAPPPPDVAMPRSQVAPPCSPDSSPTWSPMGDASRSEAPLFDHMGGAPEDGLLDESFVAGPADAATDELPRVEAARPPAAPPRAWALLPSVGTWLRPAPRPLRAVPAPAPAAAPPALVAAAEGAEEGARCAAPAAPRPAVEDEAFVAVWPVAEKEQPAVEDEASACVLAWPAAEEAPKDEACASALAWPMAEKAPK
ncbi:unnamed protein product, partial [Prorocentrum cordatum]